MKLLLLLLLPVNALAEVCLDKSLKQVPCPKVEWMQDEFCWAQPEAKPDTFYASPRKCRYIQFGFREDGVVIWREKETL